MADKGLISESNKVTMILMGGEEAGAVAEVVGESQPGVTITNHGAYIEIEADRDLHVDLPKVSERLGRPYGVETFLVILSSYVGRINVDDRMVSLSTEIG